MLDPVIVAALLKPVRRDGAHKEWIASMASAVEPIYTGGFVVRFILYRCNSAGRGLLPRTTGLPPTARTDR
jgi:hypothetical protein